MTIDSLRPDRRSTAAGLFSFEEVEKMRTITEEVGTGPIDIIDDIERAPIIAEEPDRASGMDGKSERYEPNLRYSRAPAGALAVALDNGPRAKGLVQRTTQARKRYPLKEMYEQ